MNILIILALLLPRSEAAQESDEGEARRLLWSILRPDSRSRWPSCRVGLRKRRDGDIAYVDPPDVRLGTSDF